MSAGIDYGSGKTNIDVANGIRYGVIAQNNVGAAWYDEAVPDYGEPTCPKCGSEADSFSGDKTDVPVDWECAESGADYVCERCEYVFGAEDAFGEEPIGYRYSDGGYELTDCLDTNVMVLKSPFFTKARFCSPCVPGAGDLDNPDDDGARSYCLGPEWFEGERAPYPVYSVETGEPVPVKES